MLAYDDYLTNSTDTGLRMCACEIGPKLHLTSILSKAQIPGQAQASPRAKKAHLASTQEKETPPMRMTHHQSEVKPSRFPGKRLVVPSYKYKGRG